MAQLRCRECGNPVSSTEVVCHSCGEILLDDGATTVSPEPPAAAPSPGPSDSAGSRPGVATRTCGDCGTVVDDPLAARCPSCLAGLARTSAAPPLARRLVLRFDAGDVEVAPGQSLPLGRDAVRSPVARTLGGYDNVSRLHATVGLDGEGRAWIRDENSTNGTYVDGRKLKPGETTGLAAGAVVRLAADVPARVRWSDDGRDG